MKNNRIVMDKVNKQSQFLKEQGEGNTPEAFEYHLFY